MPSTMPAKSLDLGYQVPDYGDDGPTIPSGSNKKQKTKTVYPSINIEGDAAARLMRQLGVGDNLSGTVTVHVCGIRARSSESKREWDKDGVELEVRSISLDGITPGDAGEEEEEESSDGAMDNFFGKRGKGPMAGKATEDPETEFDEYD